MRMPPLHRSSISRRDPAEGTVCSSDERSDIRDWLPNLPHPHVAALMRATCSPHRNSKPGWSQRVGAKRRPMTGSAQSGSICAFAEIGVLHMTVTAPVLAQYPDADVPMQRGERPVGWGRDHPMFDRIEMDIISTAFEIPVVANGVFPKALLPKRIFGSREIGMPAATTLRVKIPLIRRHRSEKSESSGGSVMMACK